MKITKSRARVALKMFKDKNKSYRPGSPKDLYKKANRARVKAKELNLKLEVLRLDERLELELAVSDRHDNEIKSLTEVHASIVKGLEAQVVFSDHQLNNAIAEIKKLKSRLR